MSKLTTLRNALAFAAVAATIVICLVPTASHAESAGSVTTKSRYGVQSTSAPVRQSRNGYEVRLPGGTWVNCRRDCGQTLREETVDFWQTMREKRGGR